MIHAGTATAVHDLSDGGLLIALAEMAIAGKIGAKLDAAPTSIVPHAWWFGEDQARYVVTVAEDQVESILTKTAAVGVPCARIGTTGGDALAIAGERADRDRQAHAGVRALVPGLYAGRGGGVGAHRGPE